MKLINLTLEITNRCNMRCAMCGIWEEKKKHDLSLKAITAFFHHHLIQYPVGSVSLTGGEVFLHPKLDLIYRYLYLMKKKRKLATIDIVTSGYLTEQILGFLHRNKKYLDGLEMDFSIDGLEKNHNMQRYWPDAWIRTWKTINNILLSYPGVQITIKYTINAHNIEDIIPVYHLCKEKRLSFLPKFVEQGTTHYYHRVEKEHSLFGLTREQRERALMVLHEIQKHEQNPLLEELIQLRGNKQNVHQCKTPAHSLFVTADGMIYSCIYMNPIGNAYEKWTVENQLHQQQINAGEHATCPKCISYHGYLKSWNCKKQESCRTLYPLPRSPSVGKVEE